MKRFSRTVGFMVWFGNNTFITTVETFVEEIWTDLYHIYASMYFVISRKQPKFKIYSHVTQFVGVEYFFLFNEKKKKNQD